MMKLNIRVAWYNKVLKKISTHNAKQIIKIVKDCKLIAEFKSKKFTPIKKLLVLKKFIELQKIKIFCKINYERRW